eukprot:XP_017947710.1 PREDICTED: coiled-coil domain-containing protein 87 isoform X1 [Xenopus tropicalis]
MLKDMSNPGNLIRTKKQEYPMQEERLNTKKLNQLYNDRLKALTLFPTQSDRTFHLKDTPHRGISAAQDKSNIKKDINESIFKDDTYIIPTLLDGTHIPGIHPDAVCELVKRRLNTTLVLNIGSKEERQIFEDIILSEVKVFCDTMPHVICTGSFTTREKQQLYRRLITHLLIVSEHLFIHYLQNMELSKSQSVFSEEANLIRFKAQLLLDCSKFFNVISVRQHLINEINGLKGKEAVLKESNKEFNDTAFQSPEQRHARTFNFRSSYSPFTMKYFIRIGKPKEVISKSKRETDLIQIQNIQHLNLKEVYKLIPRQEDLSKPAQPVQCEAVSTPCPFTLSGKQETIEKETHAKVCSLKLLKQKSHSCFDLRIGDLLAAELGIALKPRASECPEICSIGETQTVQGDCVYEDLKRLMKDSSLPSLENQEESISDEDIPPLLKALTNGRVNLTKLRKMEDLLKDLNERQKQVKEPRRTQACLHPQACSIDVSIPNRPILRRADVQASERVFINHTDLSPYPPVYNDFLSEIESSSVKRLDQSLSVGSELEEVYGELINNISTDHLKFDQDLLTEPHAVSLDFSKCVSSATLTRRKKQRVINKQLDSLAPYNSSGQPLPLDKEVSRTSDSWLVWWKSSISSDDYMTYLHSQHPDYLKVIFHLYNSDSEDDGQIALMKEKERQKREQDKRLAELRELKEKYTPGMWNINSVMLGGLGKEPVDEGMEHDIMESAYQKKINAIWNALHIPEEQRLDMAIKYSFSEYRDILPQAINHWEKVTELIKKREKLLAELEMFERTASDPNRFFQKGYDGTSMARMKESKEREKLHTQLSNIERKVLEVLHLIKKSYNDKVSFKGRPYNEKLQWDKTEMLYWLQQGRNKSLLEKDIQKEAIH